PPTQAVRERLLLPWSALAPKERKRRTHSTARLSGRSDDLCPRTTRLGSGRLRPLTPVAGATASVHRRERDRAALCGSAAVLRRGRCLLGHLAGWCLFLRSWRAGEGRTLDGRSAAIA